MKTFCGCLVTKTGAMTVLVVWAIFYIAMVVKSAVDIDADKNFQQELTDLNVDCATTDNKDAWWCKAVTSMLVDGADYTLGCAIAVSLILLICASLAIYGTSSSSHWFMLPWIVAKFMVLAVFLVVAVGALILINVYDVFSGDTSLAIAVGVINAAFLAFLFYCWLCVVSHFQILREVAHLAHDNFENVQPFKNEDDGASMMGAGYVGDDFGEKNEALVEDEEPREEEEAAKGDRDAEEGNAGEGDGKGGGEGGGDGDGGDQDNNKDETEDNNTEDSTIVDNIE